MVGPPSPTILVVGDHPEICALLNNALDEDYRIEGVVDAEQAFERARTTAYDLLMVDVELPGELDGVAFAEQLREIRAYADVPLVAMTNFRGRDDRRYLLDHGFDEYLERPPYPEDVVNLVEELLIDHDVASRPRRR